MQQPDLSGLKDIHLPEKLSFWPISGTWYVAFFLVLLLVFLLYAWRLYRRKSAKVYSMKQLGILFDAYRDNGDARLLLGEVSELLKRLAIKRFGYKNIAPLSGEAWIAFIRKNADKAWDRQVAEIFAAAPYLPEGRLSKVNLDRLREMADAFIKRVG